ncbi:hypothetical protein [Dactylosporangium sp. CA-233914]|uniref:hypothetical protein n=1 Tax=Dactylosporangium sp. CA-233914 TaxID=3239934 RepID=UPI003D8D38FD
MPALTFYATVEDRPAVLEAVFGLGLFRVFEADSLPGHDLREFATAEEASAGGEWHLALHTVDAGPEPLAERIDLDAGGFRYSCEGWALIQLYFGDLADDGGLAASRTGHNSQQRAMAWADTLERLGDPAAWDFAAVTSGSGKLNRRIRRLAVSNFGARPVLPSAARLIAANGLTVERGVGIYPPR